MFSSCLIQPETTCIHPIFWQVHVDMSISWCTRLVRHVSNSRQQNPRLQQKPVSRTLLTHLHKQLCLNYTTTSTFRKPRWLSVSYKSKKSRQHSPCFSWQCVCFQISSTFPWTMAPLVVLASHPCKIISDLVSFTVQNPLILTICTVDVLP